MCLSRPVSIYLIIIMKNFIILFQFQRVFFFVCLAVLGLNPAGGGVLHIVNLIPCILFFSNVISSYQECADQSQFRSLCSKLGSTVRK